MIANILAIILGLHSIVIRRAQDIHARYLARTILIAIVVILIGFGFNLMGWKGINIAFALLFLIAFAILASRPEAIVNLSLAGITSGVVRSPERSVDQIRIILLQYLAVCKNIMLYTLLIFLALGTTSFQESPASFFIILAIAIFIILAGDVWKIGGKLGRKAIYLYACVLLIVNLLLLIPPVTWHKTIGFDPISYFRNSQTEQALAKVSQAKQEIQDQRDSRILESLARKIRRGGTLTPEEERFIQGKKEEAQKSSLPGRVSQIFESKQRQASSSRWYLQWGKPVGYKGFNPKDDGEPYRIELTRTGDMLVIQQFYLDKGRREICVLTLRRKDQTSRTFIGTWRQEHPKISGRILLTFTADWTRAHGWETMDRDNPPIQIPTMIWKE